MHYKKMQFCNYLPSNWFTIVQTAKANGLIIDKYIEYVLENINIVPILLSLLKNFLTNIL